MKTKSWIYTIGLCGALALSSLTAKASLLYINGPLGDDSQEDQLYSDATKAIDEARWGDAESLLDRVSGMHGHRADAAFYWKAYVKNKEGRPSDALASCASLRQSYPQSN